MTASSASGKTSPLKPLFPLVALPAARDVSPRAPPHAPPAVLTRAAAAARPPGSLACDLSAGGPVCRPEFLDDSDADAAGGGGDAEATLELRECRHPCAAGAGDGAFIPNDIVLGGAGEVLAGPCPPRAKGQPAPPPPAGSLC